MDFSQIPFNLASIRLGHLLPIDAFVRLSSVLPEFQNLCSIVDFEVVNIYVEASGVVHLRKTDKNNLVESKYLPEAVLNDGPVRCQVLSIFQLCPFPQNAIMYSQLFVFEVGPLLLPFVTQDLVSFGVHEQSEPSLAVTLAQIFACLGPKVTHLHIPLRCFLDAEDLLLLLADLKTRQSECELQCVNVIFHTNEMLERCLAKGVHALSAANMPQNLCFSIVNPELVPTANVIQRIKRILQDKFEVDERFSTLEGQGLEIIWDEIWKFKTLF